jgi:hypothetical protein
MNKATKSAIGVAIGAAMAGGVWYFMRTQDRQALVDMFMNDTKLPVLRAMSTAMKIPDELKDLAQGNFELIAMDELKFTNTIPPKEVYNKYSRKVEAYLKSVPQGAIDSVLDKLGISGKTVDQVKSILDSLGINMGGSSSDGSKQRPGMSLIDQVI